MSDPLAGNNLADPWWRLNNLYYIKNKAGQKVLFKPNWAQRLLYEGMWYLNIILKARQLGMTTFIQIFMLDRCLFNDNTNAGVVAHNKEDAEAFFDDKIKFAYDNLPEDLKAMRKNTSDTKRSLEFSNGSKIRVGTSLRSGTYQYVHVSEFGKMCAKYPDKADEVISGTLNTVQAGQFIFIESTAEGPHGSFYEMCGEAEAMADAVENNDVRLTSLDYKFWFFSWWEHPEYVLPPKEAREVKISEKLQLYFQQLQMEHGIKLTFEQKAWYAKKEATQKDLMKQEYPSIPPEAFERTTEVAILGKQMRQARKEGRITKLPLLRSKPVNTFWDLGRDDFTAIWFHQDDGVWHNFIYYFQDRLEDLSYYANILFELKEEYGWFYGKHYIAHDINVTDISVKGNKSRKEVLEECGVSGIVPVPKVRVLVDGIEQLRNKLPEARFDAEGCKKGLEGLEGYEWSWDDKLKVARETERKSWHRHPAEAIRQWAQAYRGPGKGFSEQQNRHRNSNNPREYARRRINQQRGTLTNPRLDHVR